MHISKVARLEKSHCKITFDGAHFYSKLYSRSAIQWAKGDQLIPSGGKKKTRKRNTAGGINAFVTRKGSLRIPGIGYQDAGIYTCMGNAYYKSLFILRAARGSAQPNICLVFSLVARLFCRFYFFFTCKVEHKFRYSDD